MGLFGKKKEVQKMFVVRHMAGLDLPESAVCTIFLFEDNLEIGTESKVYNLQVDKLRGLDYTIDIDIQQYTKSSMAKGIVGAALFGVAGAVIGSAPKTKDKASVKGNIILQYLSATDGIKYAVFQDCSPESEDTYKLCCTLRPLMPVVQAEHIDL